MKPRFKGALLLVMLAALVLAVGGAWAEKYETDAGEAESDVLIQKEDAFGGKLKRPGVPFSHQAHHEDFTIKCASCHHDFDDEGNNTWTPEDGAAACEDCHESPYTNDGKMPSLFNAFHRQCKTCHESAQAGPMTCEDCHTGE